MAVDLIEITDDEVQKVVVLGESHFVEFKSKEIAPAKLTRTLSAFANTDGGDLFVGIGDTIREDVERREWAGFDDLEGGNGHLQALESTFPLGDGFSYTFLSNQSEAGYVLKCEIQKTRDIRRASDGKAYLRRGAQNLPVDEDEGLKRLERNKGLSSFETEPVVADLDLITNSEIVIGFMLDVVPLSEPEDWLRKQQLIQDGKPTVAGLVLFSDEPQAVLPKRSGIKLYRYKTTDPVGTRETLDGTPESIEGPAYIQIGKALSRTVDVIESVGISTSRGMVTADYPETALHEVITNSVLHRDYSIADDIHIRVFDNRIEVSSPGVLPGHITPENILDERFARNAGLVRLINKFPNPPNKDVGEGLNTAFEAMRKMKLRDPVIEQDGGSVIVTLKHERLGTPEELVLEFLEKHDDIRNKQAREITYIGSENKMKTVLQRMVRNGILELVPGTTRYTAKYRLADQMSHDNDESEVGFSE